MDSQLIMFFTLIFTVIVLATVILFFSLKKKAYDFKNNRALLDEVRETVEKQIYTLNDRLILSEERWKDVNHLLINNNKSIEIDEPNVINVPFNKFIKNHGITENELLVNPRQIFVLTPFHPLFYDSFFVIKETCESLGYTCRRGDEKKIEGDIFPEMLRLIVSSGIIIANVNGRNPNVMYELGIAHALGKHVILISNAPEQLPIDIKSKQFLIYKSLNDLKESLRSELLNMPKSN